MENQYGEGGGLEVIMEGPFGSYGSMTKVEEITLLADGWKNAESPYFQIVEIEGISVNSKVDMQPELAQIQAFLSKGTVFTAVNDTGVVMVYAAGAKPDADITMQVTITEVVK